VKKIFTCYVRNWWELEWLTLLVLIFMLFSYQMRESRWFYCIFFCYSISHFLQLDFSSPHSQRCYLVHDTFLFYCQVPLWHQKASTSDDGFICWDYHVICIQVKLNLIAVVFCFSLVCTAKIIAVHCVSWAFHVTSWCAYESLGETKEKFLILFGIWTQIFLFLPHSASMFPMQFNH